jgi:hypothetical protein
MRTYSHQGNNGGGTVREQIIKKPIAEHLEMVASNSVNFDYVSKVSACGRFIIWWFLDSQFEFERFLQEKRMTRAFTFPSTRSKLDCPLVTKKGFH